MTLRRSAVAAILVAAVAAVFYFWQLGQADIVTDESSHAVRAIGMVDFDFGIEQPTPWQWIQTLPPWWMHLSFHDHPILLFLAQHLSIRALGETPFAARVPSALAGIAAVVFLYLIGRRLYSPAAGALGALLFAIGVNHVWISRIGLFESLMLAFMLASFWAFLKGLERPRWLPVAGLFLGLAVLTKYLALILIPIFVTILVWRIFSDRPTFATPSVPALLLAVAVFLAVVSPVVIYNIQLYRAFGHFDFQFSLLFGQDVPAWQSRPGQETLGTLGDRIRLFVPSLIQSNSPYFLALATLGLATILAQLIRRRRDRPLVIRHSSLVIIFAWLLPFLVFTGPAYRFLTMLTPWLAIAAGHFFTTTSTKLSFVRNSSTKLSFVLGYPLLAVLVAIEIFYAYNSIVALEPAGSKPWAWNDLRRQSHAWGFNELNSFLDRRLAGTRPETAITFEFPFAKELLSQAAAAGERVGLEPVPLSIVYDGNINLSAQLWIFLRRITYQGWPVMDAEAFRNDGEDFLRLAGVKRILFVASTESALRDRPRPPAPDAEIIESQLREAGIPATEIKNPGGEVAFRVYEFAL